TIDWGLPRCHLQLERMERGRRLRLDNRVRYSRGVQVTLTAEGARVFRRATAPHMRSIKRHFADALTPEQFAALADILRSLQHHLQPYLVAQAEDRRR